MHALYARHRAAAEALAPELLLAHEDELLRLRRATQALRAKKASLTAEFEAQLGAFGAPRGPETRAAAESAGYALAVTTEVGLVGRDVDPLAVPRIAVPDIDGEAFSALMDQVFAGSLAR